ncbi:serine hydrolase [Methylobacterium marchantiae]|uniref:Serine hydrolase n=1 Tax=Methylobacterium marchantiae TaxID=600331 RepID=A0ABW3WTU1_9HYPH|nr:Penicillin-binding protein 4* [Methylobacterium marchantiae]
MPPRLLACALALTMLVSAVAAQNRVSGAAIDGDAAAFTRNASALMESHEEGGVFSGAVIVARDGIPIFRRAYGPANREWAIPNTPDTVFRIGSITKQFTAAAILKLAEAGSLSLDDPVIRHLPELPPTWAPMTIRMLLNHSSGLPNVTALPGYATNFGRIERSPMETVALLYREDLLFPAGTGHEYSNTGYILLAGLIERITGQTFERYLNEAILVPAGLHSTRDADPGEIIPRRAAGYRRVSGEWRNALPLAASAPSGAGMLASTLDDLVAWDRALFSGRILSLASRRAMFTDYGHGYGLGWYVGTAYGRRLWSHGGFINGFSAIKDSYPDLGLTIVVLGNSEIVPAQALSRELAALYLGVPARTQISVDQTILDRYVGFYRTGPRSVLSIVRDGDHLLAQGIGQGSGEPRIILLPESDRAFAAQGDTIRVAFDIEPDGRPTGVMIHRDGIERAGPKIDRFMARRITARRFARLPPGR